jgi:AcrR family transcriptional regulator
MTESRLPAVGWGDVVGAGAYAIQERGIANVTLEDLASQLDVDPAAVSYWFADAGQVLEAVMEIRMNWFLDEARARMSAHDSQTERMREFLELSAADHDAVNWIELWRHATRDESAREARQSMADAHRRTIAGIIRAGQRTGEFGAASPDKVALIIDSLIIGFSVGATLKDSEVNPSSMHDTLLDITGRLLSVDFKSRGS